MISIYTLHNLLIFKQFSDLHHNQKKFSFLQMYFFKHHQMQHSWYFLHQLMVKHLYNTWFSGRCPSAIECVKNGESAKQSRQKLLKWMATTYLAVMRVSQILQSNTCPKKVHIWQYWDTSGLRQTATSLRCAVKCVLLLLQHWKVTQQTHTITLNVTTKNITMQLYKARNKHKLQ